MLKFNQLCCKGVRKKTVKISIQIIYTLMNDQLTDLYTERDVIFTVMAANMALYDWQ